MGGASWESCYLCGKHLPALWVPGEMARGRCLERALDKGLEVGMVLSGEQCTGDRPARGEGGSLRKVGAGLEWSDEGQ